MVATAIKEDKKIVAVNDKSQKPPLTWEVFEKKYLSREDSYTYEWVNGMVQKTKRSMDTKHFS